MLIQWTPQLIETALETLNETQRKALELYTTTIGSDAPIGTKRLKTHGFVGKTAREDYAAALNEALTRTREYFRFLGINKISDLNFTGEHEIEDGKFLKPKITRLNHEA